MKRIETLDDVYYAMDLDLKFNNYVMKIHKEDVENFKSADNNMADIYLKTIRNDLADALDGNTTLWAMHLSVQHILTKIEDAVNECAYCPPSLDESIEHWLDPQWNAFENLIIDDDKVYFIEEVYAERNDMTFIMRYPFFGIHNWEDYEDGDIPNATCVGWYAGSPSEDATDDFYGNLGGEQKQFYVDLG